MAKSTKIKSSEEPSLPEAPKGATLERYENSKGGYGYLVVGGPRITGTGVRPGVDPGKCPCCETLAAPWEPPTFSARYKQRIATIRDVHDLENDDLAHAHYLKETGGYIHICEKCGNSFFVPSSVAEIKTGE